MDTVSDQDAVSISSSAINAPVHFPKKDRKGSILGKQAQLTGESNIGQHRPRIGAAGGLGGDEPKVRRTSLLAKVTGGGGAAGSCASGMDSRASGNFDAVRTRRMSKIVDGDSKHVPVAFADTLSADKRKNHLLKLTRRADPLGMVWDVRHLAYTALPRVILSLNMASVICAYATTATLTRLGFWAFSLSETEVSDDHTAIDGMELLVTFNLVFYFGYCYNRFWQQHELCMVAKNSISAVCSLVRASHMSDEEVHNIWRWLNLAHLAGYVGLSPIYTRVNFLEGVAKEHSLIGRKSIEFSRLNDMDTEGTGPATYGEFLIWALRGIEYASSQGTISFASAQNCQAAILSMRAGMTGLFDLQFQVIPFCYVHLVALLTNGYLVVMAIAKGRLFTPDAGYARGLGLPALALFFLTISCLSLVEIGGRMQNPLGADDEDLPVHTICNNACKVSKLLVEARPPLSMHRAGGAVGRSPSLSSETGLSIEEQLNKRGQLMRDGSRKASTMV